MRWFLVFIVAASSSVAAAAPCADGDACYADGERLEVKAPAAALAAFDRGCRLYHHLSCVRAAYLLRSNKLGKPDLERAHVYFVQACGEKFEHPLACAVVGLDLLQDVGGTGDHAENVKLAASFLSKSCADGSGYGCNNLGVMWRDGMIDSKPAPSRAYAAFERACKLGEASGCNNQGIALAEGNGTAKDALGAVALFEKACSGEPTNCFNLARALAKGVGIKRDEVRARALYGKACDADEPAACYNLALMLRNGRGGPVDDTAAQVRLAKACKGGVQSACD
jgi:TPR repeat protein